MTGTTVTWTSSADSAVTVGDAGLARAVGNGGATVTALVREGASGTASITVRQVPSTVSVSPAADTLLAGDTLRLAAEAFDANGHAVTVAAFSWSSSDSTVAAVDSLGLVKSRSDGGVVITATTGGASGHAELLVSALVPAGIDVAPDTVAFTALGDTIRLATEVLDQRGRVLGNAQVVWSSADGSVATVDTAGLVTAVGEGSTILTATSGTVSASAEVSVVQVARAISVSPATATIGRGETVQLVARAVDANGHAMPTDAFLWSSSPSSVASVGADGLVRGLADGLATITAEAGDAKGSSEIVVGKADRTLLAAFYRATGGRNWTRSDNWLTDAPLADWYGIAVSPRGHVSELSLPNNNLTGTIPPTLGHFPDLRSLNLAGNLLEGSVPVELGNLARLERLELQVNRFTSLPATLGHLTRLQHLNVGGNRLSGTLPPEPMQATLNRDITIIYASESRSCITCNIQK